MHPLSTRNKQFGGSGTVSFLEDCHGGGGSLPHTEPYLSLEGKASLHQVYSPSDDFPLVEQASNLTKRAISNIALHPYPVSTVAFRAH